MPKKLILPIIFASAASSTAFAAQPGLPAGTDPQAQRRVAFVHLFEWKWTDVALECEQYLGPKGYSAVQVSPAQEHRVAPGFPWYQRYQPVSYRLESRGGTRAEFAEMIARCQKAGVDVYADAVINHMTGIRDLRPFEEGSGGTPFQPYEYPGNYRPWDFHNCGRVPDNDISNYQDRWEIQNCELVDLADLKTGSEYVRSRLAAYLNDLLSLGVRGLRIDAAKHMPAGDVGAILSQVNGKPFTYLEVIEHESEPIRASEYFAKGMVTEFKYGNTLASVFRYGSLASLESFGEGWGLMPSTKAIVFTDNHDNQRGHGSGGNVLTFKDGKLHELANIFMLAWPYGYPQVMSSYAFDDHSAGPPSEANGATLSVHVAGDVQCFREWQCEHRRPGVTAMVEFRKVTEGTDVREWWTNGRNQISFARGDVGFVAINREQEPIRRTFRTGLPAGTYCDIISSGTNGMNPGQACEGKPVTVNANGEAIFEVAPMSAVAIHVRRKL